MSPFYRLYHTCGEWIVDTGDPLQKKVFREVLINCPGSTNSDDGEFCFEFYDAVLREEDGVGYLDVEET